MAKLKLTKGELKRQKEILKRYEDHLPTLQLKKQLLQLESNKIQALLARHDAAMAEFRAKVARWVAVFGEKVGIEELVSAEKVIMESANIAGVDIPVFRRIDFREKKYDLVMTPLWVDEGIKAVKEMTTLNAQKAALERQLELVRDELRTTTQRVNLFEKIKIPETKENIRKIRIFLADMMTAAVVTGRIAKEKIEAARAEEALI